MAARNINREIPMKKGDAIFDQFRAIIDALVTKANKVKTKAIRDVIKT